MNVKTCLLLLLLCLSTAGPAGAQVKTLVFCSQESPDIFNPQLSLAQSTFDATSRQVYDRLVEYAPDGPQILPALAESWEISEDGLRYRFRLRRHVTFHEVGGFSPSRPLNARDVVFSFMRQLDDNNPYHFVSGGKYPYFHGLGLDKTIESVTAGDAYTVVFKLKSPLPEFLAILTLDFASVMSAEYADAMMAAGTPEKVDWEPVGTGPFKFVRYERDALIRYVSHPTYWRGKAPLDNLIFHIVPDATTRYQKLRDGECDVIASPDAADIPEMRLDSDIHLISQTGMDVGYLAFNTGKPPLNNRNVRQALAMAIDRRAILKRVYQDLGHPAVTMFPYRIGSDARPSWPPPPNREGARRMLEEAGVTGLELEIWPSPVGRPYMPDPRRTAEMIRDDWAQIGVKAKIVSASGRDFIKKTMVGRHDVALFGWIADTMDPSMFLSPILGCAAAKTGANRAFWCNENFDRLLRDAANTHDGGERATLYEMAQSLLDKEMPVLPIANSVHYYPVASDVVNLRTTPFGGHYFFGADRN